MRWKTEQNWIENEKSYKGTKKDAPDGKKGGRGGGGHTVALLCVQSRIFFFFKARQSNSIS